MSLAPTNTNNLADLNILVVNTDKTFYVDKETNQIIGLVTDYKKLIRQTVDIILGIDRYHFQIYSNNIGVELVKYVGKTFRDIVPTLETDIAEALLTDDRIIEIIDFYAESEGTIITIYFKVISIFGEVDITKGLVT